MANQSSVTKLVFKARAISWSPWFRGLSKVLESNKCLEELEILNCNDESDDELTEDDKAAFELFQTALKSNATLKKVKLCWFEFFGVPEEWIERDVK